MGEAGAVVVVVAVVDIVVDEEVEMVVVNGEEGEGEMFIERGGIKERRKGWII